MNILVTGSKGQLGSELREAAHAFSNFRFVFTDKEELDVCRGEEIYRFMKKQKIGCLINAAAYTAVDRAEEEREEAMKLNSVAVRHMAEAAARLNALMIQLSTDYVFEGTHYRPYTESDRANPRTVYGKSKLDGEVEVLFNAKRALIIRTAWLYSPHGHNFVRSILKKAAAGEDLHVVSDQVGSPTYARDLARAILQIIPRLPARMRTEIYHYSNEGVASWFDFARAIVEIKKLHVNVVPVDSTAISTTAPRPFYSVLDKKRIKTDFGLEVPYWRDSLAHCLARM